MKALSAIRATDIEEEIMNAYLVSITGLKDSDLFLCKGRSRYNVGGVSGCVKEIKAFLYIIFYNYYIISFYILLPYYTAILLSFKAKDS